VCLNVDLFIISRIVSFRSLFHSVIADGRNERLNDSVRHRNGVSKSLFVCLVLRVLLDRGKRAIKYGGAEWCAICWKLSVCVSFGGC
jgi:hypothetical protein